MPELRGVNAPLDTARDRSPGEKGEVVLGGRGLHKRFAHVHALRGVDVTLRRGEILAVIGDNGAGKSTLAKVLSGVVCPDAGWIEIGDARIERATPGLMNSLGIDTVYQTLSLGPDLSIADNVFLGRELLVRRRMSWLGILDRKKMAVEAARALERVGWDGPPPEHLVRELSGGQQQAVAVARSMLWAERVIILDEPTAALAARQIQKTNDVIRAAANHGLGVLVITHDIPNMLTYAHRILVMRRGRVIREIAADDTDVRQLVELMVGRDEDD